MFVCGFYVSRKGGTVGSHRVECTWQVLGLAIRGLPCSFVVGKGVLGRVFTGCSPAENADFFFCLLMSGHG